MRVVLHDENHPKPTADGIVAEIFSDFLSAQVDYWTPSTQGDFYLALNLQEEMCRDAKIEPGEVLFFDVQLWRIAESS